MATEKQSPHNETNADNEHFIPSGQPDEHAEEEFIGHGHQDVRDMFRLGKQQEFMRNFKWMTSVAFTSCVMGTWELALTSNSAALLNGGLAGLWWQFIWCYVGQTAVVYSLAEMSSMAPTSGGQYHWVSEFAPPRLQKVLSYTSGWLCTIAWQSFIPVDLYICAGLVQACITLNHPTYAPQRWHTSLLMIGFCFMECLVSVLFVKWLPSIEFFFAVLHFVAWIPIVIVLWAMSPVKQSARVVFTQFTDNGSGWSSLNSGLMVCIGQVGAIFTVLGSDGAVHIGEETSGASVAVPQSMLASYFLNIVPTLVALITFVFCIDDLETVLASPTGGFAVVNVFQSATGSTGGATGLTVVMLILLLIISTSCITSTSRETFAFARDNGLVGSSWIARVDDRLKVPINATIVTMGFCTVMAIINIGSDKAFNAFLSVSTVALMATYTISIGCVFVKRLRGQTLPRARWRLFGKNGAAQDQRGGLGRYGSLINGIAMCYSIWSFFWSFWPTVYDPTAATMNWAILIFGAIMLLAAIAFAIHVRKVYDGPVAKVRTMNDEFTE